MLGSKDRGGTTRSIRTSQVLVLPSVKCKVLRYATSKRVFVVLCVGRLSATKTMQFTIIQEHYKKATKEESNRGAWKSDCSQMKDAQSSIKKMCYSFLKEGSE